MTFAQLCDIMSKIKREEKTMKRKDNTLKTLKAKARELVPMSQLVGRFVPMKKQAKLDKVQRKEARNWE